MKIEKELREYIATQLVSEDPLENLDADDDLIDLGVLNSLAVVQLVTHIETVYGFELEIGEITPENVGSIRRLAAFVERKTGARHVSI